MAVEVLTLLEIASLPRGENDGYAIRYLPKGHPQSHNTCNWQTEHRLAAEAILGRRLKPNEWIHHRNDYKLDNTPENLILTDKSKHGRIHNPLKGEFRKCLHCQKVFYRPRAWIMQGRGLYCSTPCAAHSPARVDSAERNLTGKVPDLELNTYIAQQKDSGRTWSSLARELGKAIGTIRDRYRWYKQNVEVSHVGRT